MIEAMERNQISKFSIDRLGAIGGSVCAVHCMVCAFMPSLLVVLGLDTLLSSSYEWGFTILSITLASFALIAGYRKHRSKKVAMMFCVGIVGLILSRVVEEGFGAHHVAESAAHHHESLFDLHALGALIGVSSAIFIVVGHLKSIRLSKCCDTESCQVS